MSLDKTSSAALTKDALLARLKPIGQQHLVAFWDQLDNAQRTQLSRQIEQIDAGLFNQLRRDHHAQAASGKSDKSHWSGMASRAQSPPGMLLDGSGVSFTAAAAREAGAGILQAGQVGMILVAGGLGTRLG